MVLFVKAKVMNIKLQMILIHKIIFYPEVIVAIQSEAVFWVYYLMGSLEDQVRFKEWICKQLGKKLLKFK